MSYNITRFRIDEMRDLVIPLSALTGQVRPRVDKQGNYYDEVELDCEMGYIRGDTAGDRMGVIDITCYGEGSGNWGWPKLEKILAQSTGWIQFMLVWEGGDRVETVVVNNGVIDRMEL